MAHRDKDNASSSGGFSFGKKIPTDIPRFSSRQFFIAIHILSAFFFPAMGVCKKNKGTFFGKPHRYHIVNKPARGSQISSW